MKIIKLAMENVGRLKRFTTKARRHEEEKKADHEWTLMDANGEKREGEEFFDKIYGMDKMGNVAS